MDERTTGIILRTRPLTETSLIVHWLTPDLGRIATVARGARRPKSPFRGKLDLFYLAEISFARSRRSDLHTLREAVLRATHSALREELVYLRQAVHCAALVEQSTETETPLPAIFQLMADLLDHLPRQPPQPITTFAFEMKLLAELGLRPSFPETNLSAGARKILEIATTADWPTLSRLRLTETQTKEIGRFLHGFLIYHLGEPLARGSDRARRKRLPHS